MQFVNLVYSMPPKALFLAQEGEAAETGSLFHSCCQYCAIPKLSQCQLQTKAQNILRNCLGRCIYWLSAVLFKGYITVWKDPLPIISLTEHYIPFTSFHLLYILSLLKHQQFSFCLFLKSKFQTGYYSNLNTCALFLPNSFSTHRPLFEIFFKRSFTNQFMYDSKGTLGFILKSKNKY